MRRPLVYDITRLLTRVFARTPNGIDRVDFSFADYFLRDDQPRRSGLVMTPFGPRVLPPIAAREAIANIRMHWGRRPSRSRTSNLPPLRLRSASHPGPSPKISVARRGQYAEALSWLRRHGLPMGESPANSSTAAVSISMSRSFRWESMVFFAGSIAGRTSIAFFSSTISSR